MCGIAGFIYKDKKKAAEQSRLKKMVDAIAHRGPDAEGMFCAENIALGHRRLSIIDLSEQGNQPMYSHDGRYVIVFNGEIYNYIEIKKELSKAGAVFTNQTDTEVIIEAYRYWGAKCVKRFNGMWAFCIYDREMGQLFFSRDRFAVKPLYIVDREDAIVFGSEAKAVIAGFPEENVPSSKMIYRFLWAAPEDRDEVSYYKNIKIFERASCMLYDLNKKKWKKGIYWDVDEEKFRQKWIAGRNPVKTFQRLIEDAVKLRLRADVEVGACLSGGLDSSTIVGICSKKFGIRMHTFSSVYSDKDCNEKEYIDLVNEYNHTIPHLIYPEPENTDLIKAFQDIIYHHDGPNLGASLYSQYSVMQGVQGNVKIVLDGQGADELFAGYIPYYGYHIADILNKNTARAKRKAIKTLAVIAAEWPDMLQHIQSDAVINAIGADFYKKLKEMKDSYGRDFVSSAGNHPLFTEEFLKNVDQGIAYSEKNISGILNTRLCKDVTRDSIPGLLHNEDGNSMAFSIESRIPFLDYRIVEFGLALDGNYKIRNEWTKWIVRKSCRKYLPKKVAYRKNKMGFPAPFARWLREGRQKEEMKEIIYAFGDRNIVPKDTIDFFYRQHMNGEADRNVILYKFLVLELWLRTCREEKSAGA